MSIKANMLLWGGVVGASLVAHAAVFGGFARVDAAPATPHRRGPTLVEMTVAPSEPPAPSPKVAHNTVGAKPVAAKPVRRRTASHPSPPADPAPAPVAETPADFTGLTLTNEGQGAGWASATGNGAAMNGPVGTPGAKVTGRSRAGMAERSADPPVVGIGDLSRPPVAPDLASVLARFYPAQAKKLGLTGKAVVRARVMPDGHIRELALVSETQAGFGDACRRTLDGSHWTAPVDQDGRQVSTYVHYACRFEVQ